MARDNAKGAPKGRGGSGGYSGFSRHRLGELHMLVVVSNDDLGQFCDTIFSQIEGRLEAQGGQLRVTGEQFKRYVATAIKVRIEHVTRSSYRALGYEYTGMRVNEGWALPTPVHDLLSSLGEIKIDGGEVLVKPLWDSAADDLVMDARERDTVTRDLRSALSALNVSYQNDMSRDAEGRHSVMVLTYVPQYEEWWHDSPIAWEDAHSSMILGLTPVTDVERGHGGAQYQVVDVSPVATALTAYPVWVPAWTLDRRVVARFSSEAAKLAG